MTLAPSTTGQAGESLALSVLIVEDNSTTQVLLDGALRSFGFEPTIASSAEEAMEAFEESAFRIIVLDLVLPGMRGDAFCRWIRQHRDGADTYILVGTAGTSGQDLKSVLEAGANDYIEKPYVPNLLRTRMEVARREVVAILERREFQERLREERDSVAAVLDGVATVIVALDRDHNIVRANQSFRNLVGHDITNHTKTQLADFLQLGESSRKSLQDRLSKLTRGDHGASLLETEVTDQHGHRRILNWAFTTMSGSQEAFLCAGTDITERHEAERRLAYLATHDELTGLLNRTNLDSLLKKAIARAEEPASSFLFYIDLDNFKTVNDTAGHLAGDELLTAVAGELLDCIQPSDAAIRFGGDEFVLLLHNRDAGAARQTGERILARLADIRFERVGRVFPVRASIGAAAIEAGLTAEQAMIHADTACYASKRCGRNQLSLYTPEMAMAEPAPTS